MSGEEPKVTKAVSNAFGPPKVPLPVRTAFLDFSLSYRTSHSCRTRTISSPKMQSSWLVAHPTRERCLRSLLSSSLTSFTNSVSSRHRFIFENLTRHLHHFVRETEYAQISPFHMHATYLFGRLTTEEWIYAIQFLTKTGQNCTPMCASFLKSFPSSLIPYPSVVKSSSCSRMCLACLPSLTHWTILALATRLNHRSSAPSSLTTLQTVRRVSWLHPHAQFNPEQCPWARVSPQKAGVLTSTSKDALSIPKGAVSRVYRSTPGRRTATVCMTLSTRSVTLQTAEADSRVMQKASTGIVQSFP
jgi:hypothetical protein